MCRLSTLPKAASRFCGYQNVSSTHIYTHITSLVGRWDINSSRYFTDPTTTPTTTHKQSKRSPWFVSVWFFFGSTRRGAFACKQPLQSLCTITAASAEAPAAQVQPTTAWLLRHPYALHHSQGEHPPIHARAHTSTSRPCPVVYCVGILYFVPRIGLVLCTSVCLQNQISNRFSFWGVVTVFTIWLGVNSSVRGCFGLSFNRPRPSAWHRLLCQPMQPQLKMLCIVECCCRLLMCCSPVQSWWDQKSKLTRKP